MREMSHSDVRCDSGAVVTCHESRCHEGPISAISPAPPPRSRQPHKSPVSLELERRELVRAARTSLQCPLALSPQWSRVLILFSSLCTNSF